MLRCSIGLLAVGAESPFDADVETPGGAADGDPLEQPNQSVEISALARSDSP
jgi:hypothetical protein